MKAETGDVSRFRSGEQLCSYAGIVPFTHSSGGVTRHGRITRDGSRWLRWAMVEAAMTHLKYDSSITRAYHGIAERRGRQVAVAAAARRLLLCCWSVLKHRRPYRPSHGQAFNSSSRCLQFEGEKMNEMKVKGVNERRKRI